eukprot:scaffold659_cov192-Ochromonas_danica.AAC.49
MDSQSLKIPTTLLTGVIDQDSYEVLAAVCDTLIPSFTLQQCSEEKILDSFKKLGVETIEDDMAFSLTALRRARAYLCYGALDYGTPQHVAAAIQELVTKPEQEKFYLALKTMSTSLGNLVLTGYPTAFQELPRNVREKILFSFQQSQLEAFQALFMVSMREKVFKRLAGGLFLSYAEKGQTNPAWDFMGYDLSARKDPSTLPAVNDDAALLRQLISYDHVMEGLRTKHLDPHSRKIQVDAIIVGSGCGGGIMAYQLVEAGYSVLVLEKGGYYQTEDFAKWTESEAMAKCFEKGGLLTSEDSNILFLAGSCVGGGSTVNWCASFATPEHVLEDWANEGKGGRFHSSLETVTKLMNVNSNCSHHHEEEECDASFKVNGNNRKLWKGAEKIGYKPEKIPRNVKQCVDCGHCNFGCSHDSKQSVIKTLLEPLLLRQARQQPPRADQGKLYIIPDCKVDRILLEKDEEGHLVAKGITATVTIFRDEGIKRIAIQNHEFQVNGKVVISAAGSLQTPPLLLRSGLQHPLVGANLTIHPVLGVGGIYPDKDRTGLHTGVSMGVVARDPPICAPNTPRQTVAVETPPVHAGLMGVIAPFRDALGFKVSTLGWKNLSVLIGIARDKSQPSNRIVIDRFGDPIIRYRVADHDKPTLLAGAEAMLRITYAAGARLLFISHSKIPWFTSQPEDTASNAQQFEDYIDRVKKDAVKPYEMMVVTAHHMSSCRMAADSSQGPVSPTGEMFECRNLFVADGSVLPSSLGINPMITIEAVAHMLSFNVIEHLKKMN